VALLGAESRVAVPARLGISRELLKTEGSTPRAVSVVVLRR